MVRATTARPWRSTTRARSIADVLNMPIEEGAEFFAAFTPIARHLRTLVDVGLGYVRLGQASTTLSGGEAQRVKLAAELQKRSNGRSIYVLDEPTTGLHFEDIRKLLLVLQGLVDKGNTVITIEHNLDVIKSARTGSSTWARKAVPAAAKSSPSAPRNRSPRSRAATPESSSHRCWARRTGRACMPLRACTYGTSAQFMREYDSDDCSLRRAP